MTQAEKVERSPEGVCAGQAWPLSELETPEKGQQFGFHDNLPTLSLQLQSPTGPVVRAMGALSWPCAHISPRWVLGP